MSTNKQLTIKEFARLTGIKAENLRFYDRIGLLKPEARGENAYRYYGPRQLATAYLIASLRSLDVGLKDIGEYAKERSPEKMLELFAAQEGRIQEEMARLREARDIMHQYAEMAKDALQYGKAGARLRQKEREPLFLCPPPPPGMDEDEAGIQAYEYATGQGVNAGVPFGALLHPPAPQAPNTLPIAQFYLKTSRKKNAYKPAGLYAVAYAPGDPSAPDGVVAALLRFLEEKKLQACGGIYVEQPLNEMAMPEEEHYCTRAEVLVQGGFPAV